MNIFVLSPGRTATTTLSYAFSKIEGYTSGHEINVQYLGQKRVDYPLKHIECDNRLVWFLPRLTKKYSKDGVLVIIYKDFNQIADSYNKRWYKINMMKSYSQGILMRSLNQNTSDVCLDYVENVYEHLEYFSDHWEKVVRINLDSPRKGLTDLLKCIDKENDVERILKILNQKQLNKNLSRLDRFFANLKFNFKALIHDFFN